MNRKLIAFTLLCLVSLTADITYEGARAVVGPYLEILGASAIIAGLATLGDLLGYVARLVSGVLVSKFKSSRALWVAMIGGYAINLFSVPPLALASDWRQVLGLVVAERVGKGLRTPCRDVVLAEVSEVMGRGKGFGIHEVADQVGAIVGPAVIAAIASYVGIKNAFLSLAIPAAVSMALVVGAYASYPRVESLEAPAEGFRVWGVVRGKFLRFLVATSLLGLGFVPWSVLSFVGAREGLSVGFLAIAYSIAMAVDAAIALPMGWLYDKLGPRVLAVAPLACSLAPIALLGRGRAWMILCAASWGACMGVLESAFRAAVAEMVEPRYRAAAYGLAYFVFGISWLACGVYSGYVVQVAPHALPLVTSAFLIASTIAYLSCGGRG